MGALIATVGFVASVSIGAALMFQKNLHLHGKPKIMHTVRWRRANSNLWSERLFTPMQQKEKTKSPRVFWCENC